MSVPTAWHSARALAAFFSVFLGAVGAAGAASEPSWLALKPGQTALVGAAPWPMEQPEAALSGSPRSAAVSPDDYARRPDDALHQPIGLRVTVEDIVADGVARVRTVGAPLEAFTRLDQLVPEVPPGTQLVVAGGFGNYADFFPDLSAPESAAQQLPTGTSVLTLGLGIAPYDPEGSDFIRTKVYVQSGPQLGRTGWIAVGFTGLPDPNGTPASTAERACRCRILEFR